MNDAILSHFRDLADAMSKRKKVALTISFRMRNGEQKTISAKYDPMFKTVEFGNATVPTRELSHWLKLLCSADPETIRVTY